MQEIESAILAELARLDGRITTVRFLFYRLVAQAVIPKSLPGKRQPSQYVSDVARDLRESGVVPLDAIVDDGRGIDWNVAFSSVKAGLTAQIDAIRLDPWTNEHACVPFLVVESRSLARVLVARPRVRSTRLFRQVDERYQRVSQPTGNQPTSTP